MVRPPLALHTSSLAPTPKLEKGFVMSITRNDPCVCGSGLKYKKCCLGGESTQVVRSRKVTRVSLVTLTLVSAFVVLQLGLNSGAAVALSGLGLLGGYMLMQDS
jgi:hypothetical protein